MDDMSHRYRSGCANQVMHDAAIRRNAQAGRRSGRLSTRVTQGIRHRARLRSPLRLAIRSGDNPVLGATPRASSWGPFSNVDCARLGRDAVDVW
jgi:hypothetical protein